MKCLLCILLLFTFTVTTAADAYHFTATCQQAYQAITELRITTGQALIEKAKQQDPHNRIPVFLENYIDFLVLFFNESTSEFHLRYPRFLARIDQFNTNPIASPFHKYALATMRMHRAIIAVKSGKMWDAGWDFRRSWILIKENKKEFPSFLPNNLLHGTLQAVVGTIPKGYKWLASLLGMRGSLTDGMAAVRSSVYSNDPLSVLLRNESYFIYPYLLFHLENKKEEALQFIKQEKLDIVNNHLYTYMAANLTLNKRQSSYTKAIILKRNTSPEYMKCAIWDFEMGYAHIYHLDAQEAIRYFTAFFSQFNGRFYAKDAYWKLSLSYYLQGNMPAAEAARKEVLTKGSLDAEADKQAFKEAKTGIWPNLLLLKARLLNDGGYHAEALAVLHGKTDAHFVNETEKLEFIYRVGRIYDDLGREEEAIQAYRITIQKGAGKREHYAARAAWQVGQLFEKKGDKKTALFYYQQCLEMEGHEYKNSLDQRAKAGIARCKAE